MNFKSLHEKRKSFINSYKSYDHIVVEGKNRILISAPHGVSQVRLGKPKFSEIGSLVTALVLQEKTNSWLIAKTKNNNDDANFDESSSYKQKIEKLIERYNIDYLIDIHGLSSKRDCDVNLGVCLGRNISVNEEIFNLLFDSLVKNGFKVTIDQPFMAGVRTISGSMANKFSALWTIQIEINCAITNKKENFDKFKSLINLMVDWINKI